MITMTGTGMSSACRTRLSIMKSYLNDIDQSILGRVTYLVRILPSNDPSVADRDRMHFRRHTKSEPI